ncbi:hexulose-6-phosphate synthase [Nostoc sp. CENA543]|uniref:type II toxin-antitoxin system HicA family toxin n=1 Tax=Nostoc sp. CENA543 TaxID=1869241 RepID=UPI000CA3EAF5|nr:type II toxin-antitoxin system HicA family toxin [Nostoc sp. CENA543]AUT02427.1 hexulose-6-phosphate synthase [Nostoc sp. CENA543]
MEINSKHKKTLDDIFETPIKSNISWSDIESMLIALGAEVSEGRGSRVRIVLNGVKATFHRPNPEKETDKGAVKSMRRFLTESGIKEVADTGETGNDEI